MSQEPPWDPYGQQGPSQYQSQRFLRQSHYRGQSYPGQPPYLGQAYQGQSSYPGRPDGPPQGQRRHPGPGYGYDPQSPRRRRNKHRVRNILAGIGTLIVAAIAISALSSHGSGQPASSPASAPIGSPSASAASSPAAVSSSPAARPTKDRTVAVFTGLGQENTPRFTVTSTWKLAYSFSCKRFGQPGNFQVFENGGGDFSGILAYDLAMSESASTWANADAGTHYLQIISECAWTIRVVDEP
jgi:hypothetical protein